MSQAEYKRDRHEKSKLPEELHRNLLEERFRSNHLLTVALLTVYLRSQARACLSANAVESPRLKCQHLPAYMLRPSTCPNLPVSDRNLSNSDMGVGHSILWLSKKRDRVSRGLLLQKFDWATTRCSWQAEEVCVSSGTR